MWRILCSGWLVQRIKGLVKFIMGDCQSFVALVEHLLYASISSFKLSFLVFFFVLGSFWPVWWGLVDS